MVAGDGGGAVEVAGLDRLDEAGAGLGHHGDVAGAEAELAREGVGAHRGGRREERHVAEAGMGRGRVVAPVAAGEVLDHRDEDPEHAVGGAG